MLAVILKILSIIGIVLLVLIGVFLLVCLLVLFVPVSYRVTGHKVKEETVLKIRMGWLFRLVRASYDYPEPACVRVKALFFTVYDSKKEASPMAAKHKTKKNAKGSADGEMSGNAAQDKEQEKSKTVGKEQWDSKTLTTKKGQSDRKVLATEEEQPYGENASGEETDSGKMPEYGNESGDDGFFQRIFAKFEKLKYTIHILCDKIKEIRENISYYKRLWEREETRQVFQYALVRAGKILKNIKPRKWECSLVYGAETPDVTGYLYGIYAMFCPSLGSYYVDMVPDFTQKIFEGKLDAAGHITVFQVLWNTLLLLLDKRFRLLRNRLKRHKAKMAASKDAAASSASSA